MDDNQKTMRFLNYHVAMVAASKKLIPLVEPASQIDYHVPTAWEGLQNVLNILLWAPA